MSNNEVMLETSNEGRVGIRAKELSEAIDEQLANTRSAIGRMDPIAEAYQNANEPGSRKMREIRIVSLHRGHIVSVGCHDFAFSTKEEMTEKLIEYINAPGETEKKWEKGELF